MSKNKRGNVWLGVAGLTINESGEWLTVKKQYSGLKGKWSLPAGFVKGNETADEAAVREVGEETGIISTAAGLIGFRSGVIRGEISDNMAVFLLQPVQKAQKLQPQLKEVSEAKWIHPEDLSSDPDTSIMLKEMTGYVLGKGYPVIEGINPGEIFGYSKYKMFFEIV